MDYERVQAIVTDVAQKEKCVIYMAIGCALGRYPKGEHPAQQYPPFMKEFPYTQICILIDPCLELPPRVSNDLPALHATHEIMVLPIQSTFEFVPDKNTPDSKFLDALLQLCVNPSLSVHMIVQDYSGRDIQPYYPVERYGERLRTNVLYDATYGDGGCFPDVSAMKILRKGDAFVQPKFLTLEALRRAIPPELAKREFQSRRYPIFKFALLHRVYQHIEEPRDWCREEDVVTHVPQYCTIYNLATKDCSTEHILRVLLLEIVQDLCTVSDTYLSKREMEEIVNGSRKGMETLWKVVESISFSQ